MSKPRKTTAQRRAFWRRVEQVSLVVVAVAAIVLVFLLLTKTW